MTMDVTRLLRVQCVQGARSKEKEVTAATCNEDFEMIRDRRASKPQAASRKPQAASRKPQAASRKPQGPRFKPRGRGSNIAVLRAELLLSVLLCCCAISNKQ
jgi:hypothetical protein